MQLMKTGAGKGQNVPSALSEKCPGGVLGAGDRLEGELYNVLLSMPQIQESERARIGNVGAWF